MTHTISPENRELELGIQQKINECLDNFESFCFNAGAGAGKTYALQKSIEHILKTKGENLKLSNQKILCITYTNAAKDEILNRLGKNSSSVVSTIHEFLWGFISIQQGLLTVEHNNKIKEELNKIEQKLPDIILTDVMMPEMDGNKLCHMVKRDTKTSYIPVVMLTARLSEENEIESRECGADDYITKPFNIEILKMHIRNLLKRCSAVNDGKLDPQITQVQITPLDEKLVTDATAYVEKNLSNTELSVVSLSEAMNMSRVNLYRKLISVTGNTPSEFIRLIRLRHAEQLLMKSQLSISEISYMVGFSSQRYFSKCYKDLFGYMPSRYKRNK